MSTEQNTIVPAGRYTAKAIKGQFFQSEETKNPGIKIAFEILVGDKKRVVVWTQFMRGKDDETTDKMMTRAIEGLALSGYDENKGHTPEGIIPKESFDPSAECDVTVEHETYQTDQGDKTIAKVAWVNKVGGAGFKGSEPEAIKSMMAGIDIKNKLLIARKDFGIKAPETAKSPTSGLPNFAPQAASTTKTPPQAPPPMPKKESAPAAPASLPEPSFDTNDEVPF